jgi:hypothetical protein
MEIVENFGQSDRIVDEDEPEEFSMNDIEIIKKKNKELKEKMVLKIAKTKIVKSNGNLTSNKMSLIPEKKPQQKISEEKVETNLIGDYSEESEDDIDMSKLI